MYKTLRIIFTILSTICLTAVIPIGTILGFDFALGVVIGAIVFFFAMLHFKQKQEEATDETSNEADFLNPADTQNPEEK